MVISEYDATVSNVFGLGSQKTPFYQPELLKGLTS